MFPPYFECGDGQENVDDGDDDGARDSRWEARPL